jgi:hypothetical protein
LDGEAVEHKIGHEQDRANREQRGEGVSHVPALAQDPHPPRVPVGIERGLRKAEIDVRHFACVNQLRRQQMIALIIKEGDGFGVNQEHRGIQRQHAIKPPVGTPAIGMGVHQNQFTRDQVPTAMPGADTASV